MRHFPFGIWYRLEPDEAGAETEQAGAERNLLDTVPVLGCDQRITHKALMDIYNASATLPPEDFSAFTSPPDKVVLRPPEALYRFASIISPTFEGNRTFDSPWWIPPATYRRITKTAHRRGSSIINVARAGLAVLPAWNPDMDWLIIIELRRPVYAWIGPARRQWLPSRERPGFLPGSYVQAYVPGLAPRDALSSEAAVLSYYGSAEG